VKRGEEREKEKVKRRKRGAKDAQGYKLEQCCGQWCHELTWRGLGGAG
jgi:hypothetical protein